MSTCVIMQEGCNVRQALKINDRHYMSLFSLKWQAEQADRPFSVPRVAEDQEQGAIWPSWSGPCQIPLFIPPYGPHNGYRWQQIGQGAGDTEGPQKPLPWPCSTLIRARTGLGSLQIGRKQLNRLGPAESGWRWTGLKHHRRHPAVKNPEHNKKHQPIQTMAWCAIPLRDCWKTLQDSHYSGLFWPHSDCSFMFFIDSRIYSNKVNESNYLQKAARF